MWDLGVVGLVVAFFIVCFLLVAGCEQLRGGNR